MAGQAGTQGRLPWRLARLVLSSNRLRRSTDRAEAVIVVLLSAVFLAGVAAAPYVGMRVYRWERARAGPLHPAVAVLSQSGPSAKYLIGYGQAAARWRVADGRWRSGMLTTDTAPGIWGAPAGARVPIWLTRSGEPANPGSQAGTVLTAVVFAFDGAGGAGIVLLFCYWLCRLALDRRRLAAWESDWALTGPRWTPRQG